MQPEVDLRSARDGKHGIPSRLRISKETVLQHDVGICGVRKRCSSTRAAGGDGPDVLHSRYILHVGAGVPADARNRIFLVIVNLPVGKRNPRKIECARWDSYDIERIIQDNALLRC
ncbi:hypothetical protein CMI47_09615, partial [Candidatus Pacearchaeota archaeon]|nr:hypothetical protein [Candidatus Pacearchaeota archaeon]